MTAVSHYRHPDDEFRQYARVAVKLLLVEDDERVSRFVVKGLREAGHTVDHAGNGRDGILLAASESYDVVITDRTTSGSRSAGGSGDRLPAAARSTDANRY